MPVLVTEHEPVASVKRELEGGLLGGNGRHQTRVGNRKHLRVGYDGSVERPSVFRLTFICGWWIHPWQYAVRGAVVGVEQGLAWRHAAYYTHAHTHDWRCSGVAKAQS